MKNKRWHSYIWMILCMAILLEVMPVSGTAQAQEGDGYWELISVDVDEFEPEQVSYQTYISLSRTGGTIIYEWSGDRFQASMTWTEPEQRYAGGQSVDLTISVKIDEYTYRPVIPYYMGLGMAGAYISANIDYTTHGDGVKLTDAQGESKATVEVIEGKIINESQTLQVSANFPPGGSDGDTKTIYVISDAGWVLYNYQWVEEATVKPLTPNPQTVTKQTDAYWQLIETSVPDGIDSAQHDYGTYEMLLSDLGLIMLDTQSGAGVQFAWSRPPDRIPCGEEGLLEIDLGVAPYNEKSWVMQTAVGLGMDIVNDANEVLYAEYSQPLYCDVGQNGEPLEYYETFSPEANGLEAFYRQGNRLRISFLHEGDADHYVRYIYEYVPPQSYEAAVEGSTQVLPPDSGADKENGLSALAIAAIAIAGVGVAGLGIAGIAAVVAKSTAAAAVPSLPTTEYSSAQSENERIDRETRIRHAEMDRRLGLDDLEKQRTGTSAQDKIVREEMRKISEGEEKREYKERVMKKYGTDNEKVASDAAQKERDSWEKTADAWRLSGNVASAGEVVATVVGAAANAAADVITRIPGCQWYRPTYRILTSIAGETAKEIAFKNKKTYGEAIKTGLVKGTVKGVFEAARGFVSSPFDKGMTAVCGNTFGEMAGAAIEGGDVMAAGEKGMINGVYEGLTRAFTDKLATKSPVVNPPSSLWDGVKSLLNNNEVRVKTVGGPVRKLAKPYII